MTGSAGNGGVFAFDGFEGRVELGKTGGHELELWLDDAHGVLMLCHGTRA